MTTERALQKLLGVSRNESRDLSQAGSFRVPTEFRESIGGTHITVSHAVRVKMADAFKAIREDPRFERLSDNQVEKAVRWFVSAVRARREGDLIADFIDKYGSSLEERRVWYSITYLTVERSFVIGDVTISPVDNAMRSGIRDQDWDVRARCIATVSVVGANEVNMIIRARRRVREALSVLRAELPLLITAADEQLRFDTGLSCGFIHEGPTFLWGQSIANVDLTLTNDSIENIDEDRASLDGVASGIRKKLEIAYGWLDRARATDDMSVRVLFLFFALEAILGDKSVGRKSLRLAFVEVLLAHVEEGSFRSPNKLHFMYEELRSDAVHGTRSFDVDDAQVRELEIRVYAALRNFITMVRREGIGSSKRLQRWFNNHEDAPELLVWLRGHSPDQWEHFVWPPR